MRLWHKKLNKSMILPVWFTRKQTQVAGTLNVTNKLPKTKHSLNIDVNQWILRSRDNIWKEPRIHKLLTGGFVIPAASNKKGFGETKKK